MSQIFYTTATVVAATSPIDVKVGFKPGKIEMVNLNRVQTPTNTQVFAAQWNYGMVSGSAIISTYNAAFLPLITYTGTNGFTLLGFSPGAQARYGAVVSAFTNANPGVITVDSVAGITASCVIRVEGLADDQSGTSLNGVYTVASVNTALNTITTTTNTAAYSVYVSGGFVSLVTNANPVIPNPPNNIYSNVPTVFNAAIQGFRIGTSCLTGASANDVLLLGVYDINVGGL